MKPLTPQASIGLIEVPATGLFDPEGRNWTSLYRHRSLISKQVLLADLRPCAGATPTGGVVWCGPGRWSAIPQNEQGDEPAGMGLAIAGGGP